MIADHGLSRRLATRWLAGPRDRLQARIRTPLEERGPGRVVDVPRRRNLDPETFQREFLRPGRPVLLEGAAADWPCIEDWSLASFAERFGDDDVVVTSGSPYTSRAAPRDTVKLREVVANDDPEHVKYLRFHPLMALHPELAEDIPMEWFECRRGRRAWITQMQFFLGTLGTNTGMHSSQMCNLFALVKGVKEWLLYPPTYTAYLDPPTTRSIYRTTRHVSPHFADPAFAPLDGYRVVMREGDVLWNPGFWWHSVRNLSDTIGVGYRWNDNRLARRMHPTMYCLDAFARDPSWFSLYRTCRAENRRARRLGEAH